MLNLPQPFMRCDEALLHPAFPAGREVGPPHHHQVQDV
jgi:hypothetical protein